VVDFAPEEENGMAEEIDGCMQVGKITGCLTFAENVVGEIRDFSHIMVIQLFKCKKRGISLGKDS
jgi:hypothetical protein